MLFKTMSLSTRPLNNELMYGYLWLQEYLPHKEMFTRQEMTTCGLPQNSVSFILNYWKKEKNKKGEIIYLKNLLFKNYESYKPLYC